MLAGGHEPPPYAQGPAMGSMGPVRRQAASPSPSFPAGLMQDARQYQQRASSQDAHLYAQQMNRGHNLPPPSTSASFTAGMANHSVGNSAVSVNAPTSWNSMPPGIGSSPRRGGMHVGPSRHPTQHSTQMVGSSAHLGPQLLDVTPKLAGEQSPPVRGSGTSVPSSPATMQHRAIRTPLSATQLARQGSQSPAPDKGGVEAMRGTTPKPPSGMMWMWSTPRQDMAQAAVPDTRRSATVRSPSPWRGAVASSGSIHLWTHPARCQTPPQRSAPHQQVLHAATSRSPAANVMPQMAPVHAASVSPVREGWSGRSPERKPMTPVQRAPSRDRLLSALVPRDVKADQEEAQLVAKLRNELLDSFSEEAVLEATLAQKRSHAVMQGSWIETLRKRIDGLRQLRQDGDWELAGGLQKAGTQPGMSGEQSSRLQSGWGADLDAANVRGGGPAGNAAGADEPSFPETAEWEQNANQAEQGDEDLDTEEFSLEAAQAQIANLKSLRRQVSHLEDELASRIAEIAQLGLQLHEFRAFATQGSTLPGSISAPV
mmetsp:Transcript_37558/g.66655  ORF Transcript_37558/g.66655 Transcript_37558/m.66655 type:complete len:542 (+) Transcript_37558:63-1688(+)